MLPVIPKSFWQVELVSDNDFDITSSAAWRSKKYLKLSDDEILELAVKKLNDKERVYFSREIDYRNLHEEVKKAKLAATKKRMFSSKPKWKIIVPIVIGIIFFLRKMWRTMG